MLTHNPRLAFYFQAPTISVEQLQEHVPASESQKISAVLAKHLQLIATPKEFLDALKKDAKAENINNKHLFALLRLGLTGSVHGPALHDIIALLGTDESTARLQKIM